MSAAHQLSLQDPLLKSCRPMLTTPACKVAAANFWRISLYPSAGNAHLNMLLHAGIYPLCH